MHGIVDDKNLKRWSTANPELPLFGRFNTRNFGPAEIVKARDVALLQPRARAHAFASARNKKGV